jgi:hypothetical protein
MYNNSQCPTADPALDFVKSSTDIWLDKDFSFFFRISSQQTSNFTIPGLVVAARSSFNDLKQLETNFAEPKPLAQLRNSQGPLLTLRLTFLRLVKVLCFQISTRSSSV